jgi:hypothetical protein
MSVRVTIEYRQPDHESGVEFPLARRDFEIRRVDKRGNHGNEHHEHYFYEVKDMRPHSLREAQFTHRYGDDLTIIIAKAGAAIRKKYGNI